MACVRNRKAWRQSGLCADCGGAVEFDGDYRCRPCMARAALRRREAYARAAAADGRSVEPRRPRRRIGRRA